MKVTVTAVDQNDAVLVRGTSAFGWRGKFGCPLVAGDAVFIPARGFEDNLRVGNTITVQTSYESVSQVQLVQQELSDIMQPLEGSGDYLLRGRVVFCAPQGVVKVSVRGMVFTLERHELGAVSPRDGQLLQFCLQGLCLWDTVQAT